MHFCQIHFNLCSSNHRAIFWAKRRAVFVAEFWWKVGCMGLLERETKKKREEREVEEKREKQFFYII